MPLLPLLVLTWLAQAQAAPLQVPALAPPTKEPARPTESELATLRLGIMFYDQRKYDEAIARFEEVAKDNPDNMVALYELALAYSAKKESQKAIDLAARGTQYKLPPPQLGQFYAMIGNLLDLAGEPRRAVEVYQKGIEATPAGVVRLFREPADDAAGRARVLNANRERVDALVAWSRGYAWPKGQ